MIVEDDQSYIAQGGERALEGHVVETGTAVEHQKRRFLSHQIAIWDKPSICDIDEQPDTVDKDMHAASPVGML
jgi:hypothetical protein